jgi:hypothetical protein
MESYDTAANYAGRAISVDSLSPLGYQVLGLVFYRDRQFDSARAFLTRYVKLAPECPQKEHARRILGLLSTSLPANQDQ